MGNFFNLDNPFFRFMGKVFDVIMLSVVFIVVCIPVITIGPALSALYYSSVKAIRRDRSYPVREFFKAFKRDFRQSFFVGFFLMLFGIIIYVDTRFAIEYIKTGLTNLRYIYLIIGIVISFIAVYIFPLISRFSLKTLQLFKLAFYLAIRHFLTTLVSVILLLGAALLVYLSAGLALFFVPATTAILISIMMERVLRKCLDLVKINEEGSNENKDRWYLE